MQIYRKILLTSLFLFWGTDLSTSIYYIVFFVVFFLFLILPSGKKIPFFRNEDYIALSFILIWIYGLGLGFLKGNNPSYVISNFAGMSCYLVYFMFTTVKCRIDILSKIILICGIIVSTISIYKLFSFVFGFSIPIISSILSTEDVGISSTGQFRIYFPTLTVSYALLGISLYSFLFPIKSYNLLFLNKRFFSFLFLLLVIISLFFVSSSKGFVLGGIFIISIIPLCVYSKGLIHLKMSRSLTLLVILVICVIIVLFYFDYFSIVEMMFSKDDIANVDRYNQLDYIINDCSFIGNGLGAIVPGIIRSKEGPYGFELTYINLIHKFGALSLILFSNWLYMFLRLVYFIYKRKSIHDSVIALSAMGYMFPSIGNPLVMHPSLVIMNCLTLYYIRRISNE